MQHTAASPFAIVNPQARDPVCGMTVDPARAAGSYEYAGKKWYFCSLHCLEKFRTDPAKYLDKGSPAAAPASLALHAHGQPAPPSPAPPVAGATYTCPM